jgi:hypothetical protein
MRFVRGWNVWLLESVGTRQVPAGACAYLLGLYTPATRFASISLIIRFRGTEYRCTRIHHVVNDFKSNDAERLRYLHRNMIAYFLQKFHDAEFASVVNKFLRWSTNPTHRVVLREVAA